MHECPICGQACDCDGEDTWYGYPYNMDCTCNCEEEERDNYDDDYDDDYEEAYDQWMEAQEPSRMQRIKEWLEIHVLKLCAECHKPKYLLGRYIDIHRDCLPF